MAKYLVCLLGLMPLLLLGGCSQEDDIEAIFSGGQTWHWSATYTTDNWKDDNRATDVLSREQKKEITKSNDKYVVKFDKNGTVQGAGGAFTFTGQWSADGKDQTFRITIQSNSQSLSTLDQLFYDDLRAAQYYRGDSKSYIKLFNGSKKRFIQFYVVK